MVKCLAAVKEALQAEEMAAKADLAETEGKAVQEPVQKCNQVQECSGREHLVRRGFSNKSYLIKSAGFCHLRFWNCRLTDRRRERKKKAICRAEGNGFLGCMACTDCRILQCRRIFPSLLSHYAGTADCGSCRCGMGCPCSSVSQSDRLEIMASAGG